MRDLMTRSTTSRDGRKRDLLICETVQTSALTAKLTKRFIYIVKESAFVKDKPEAEKFIADRAHQAVSAAPHRSVYKFHNTKQGKDILIQRTIGDLYVVANDRVFFIKALRYTKIEFTKEKHETVVE